MALETAGYRSENREVGMSLNLPNVSMPEPIKTLYNTLPPIYKYDRSNIQLPSFPPNEDYTDDNLKIIKEKVKFLHLTQQLEFNTERTDILQGLLEDPDNPPVVIAIAQRGFTPHAYAIGNLIVVSQSLLNMASEITTVGGKPVEGGLAMLQGVLEHEHKHIKDGLTFGSNVYEAWAGERIADHAGSSQSVRLGLITFLERSAQKHGHGRDTLHASGALRSTEMLAGMRVTTPSGKKEITITPLPDILIKPVKEPSYQEVLNALFNSIVPMLPRHREELYRRLPEELFLQALRDSKEGHDVEYIARILSERLPADVLYDVKKFIVGATTGRGLGGNALDVLNLCKNMIETKRPEVENATRYVFGEALQPQEFFYDRILLILEQPKPFWKIDLHILEKNLGGMYINFANILPYWLSAHLTPPINKRYVERQWKSVIPQISVPRRAHGLIFRDPIAAAIKRVQEDGEPGTSKFVQKLYDMYEEAAFIEEANSLEMALNNRWLFGSDNFISEILPAIQSIDDLRKVIASFSDPNNAGGNQFNSRFYQSRQELRVIKVLSDVIREQFFPRYLIPQALQLLSETITKELALTRDSDAGIMLGGLFRQLILSNCTEYIADLERTELWKILNEKERKYVESQTKYYLGASKLERNIPPELRQSVDISYPGLIDNLTIVIDHITKLVQDSKFNELEEVLSIMDVLSQIQGDHDEILHTAHSVIEYFMQLDVPFSLKVDFLQALPEKYKEFGYYHGIKVVTRLDDYTLLRNSFSFGDNAVAVSAIADNVFSALNSTLFGDILSSCDPAKRKNNSDNLLDIIRLTQMGNNYNTRELLGRLQQLGPLPRMLLAVRSLTDTRGALTSFARKKVLIDILNRSIEFPHDFIRDVISYAIKHSRHISTVALPLSYVLGPKLFSQYDMKAIDATSPRPVNIFQTPTAGLDKCMTTETAKSVVACRTAFINMLNIIDRKINTRKESKVVERPETTLEQFIHAASLSPFFTKMLQVLTQVYDLPTEVKLAMERTQFDTAVMGPLEMWEAIKTVSEQQPRFRDIVEHPTFRLGEYIGGGSLFTVFKVEYKGKLYALRMANPSPDAFIHQAYLLTIEVCDGMLKDPNYKNWHKWLRVLRTLAGVSKEWCTRELAAENIVEDDKHFEQMIQNIGKVNSTAISIPSTLYQGERCSLTELVEFELNGAEAVSQGGKNSARVIEVMDTIHQASLTTNTLKGGVQVLPDPHPGNILMTGDTAYIVDRPPYMTFNETQVHTLLALYKGRYIDFALDLLRELEIGKLQTAKVAGQTVVELRGILVGHLRGEKIDGQKVVREVLNVLAQNGVELPLEWWLYSRNCVMLESLKKSIGKNVGEEKRI